MATVTLILKKNKANKKGEMPLYIRIIKGRKTKFISTRIFVSTELWNEKKLRVKKGYPNSSRVNALIAKKLSDAANVSLEMEIKNVSASSRKIKEAIVGKQSSSIIKYIEDDIRALSSKNNIGTLRKIRAVLSKLKTFLNGADISFEDFDVPFLKRYEKYLRVDLKNSTNTIHANLRVFRKYFNDAHREDLITYEDIPFNRFKLTLEKTNKEYLTEDELGSIENLELPTSSVMSHHRDMYIFAAYAGGLRISDLLQLRWLNFDGTHIRLVTQKTKEAIPIKLPAKAMEIIEKYSELQPDKKSSDFIFPFLKNNIDYSNLELLFDGISSNTAFVNKNLKLIAKKAGLDKHISFHSSRHTWATRALRKGMRIEYVSKLMGHTSVKTTMIYAKIENLELDKAMEVFI